MTHDQVGASGAHAPRPGDRAVALSLAACSGGTAGDAGAAAAAARAKVAAVIKGLDNPFFQAMEDGIKDTADADGVDVSIQAAADIGDTTGQADKLTTLAGQDFGCFIVNPISGTNLVQALAAAAGKTIVNIDSPLDPDAVEGRGHRRRHLHRHRQRGRGRQGRRLPGRAAAGRREGRRHRRRSPAT